MAFWSSEKLKQRITTDGLITPFDERRVVHCAYELGVGSEAYVTSNPSDTTHVAPGKKIVIPPGQFGLLITQEVVLVPRDAIAFISIRAGIKFQGLVNVSGFHVDPGYKGRLKFAVYNAGSKAIVLDQEQPIFMIWYGDLDQATEDVYKGLRGSQSGISADDVMRIQGEVASPAELKKQLSELKTDYDKRIHSVEKSQSILHWLFCFIVILLVGSFVKPYLDGSKERKQDPPTQSVDKPSPAPAEQKSEQKSKVP